MLNKHYLKELLQRPNLSKTNKLLLCLAVDANQPKTVSDIRKIVVENGLRQAQKWSISSLLSGSNGARRVEGGWELNNRGRERVMEIAGDSFSNPIKEVSTSLRNLLDTITDSQVKAFLQEAVGCCEAKFYRAAIVLSWVGAVATLYNHVINTHLVAFNAEAQRRNAKWKNAKTVDDLAKIKEIDFLDILDALSIIGKNVKKELVGCLDRRNACGHPNTFSLRENIVAAHIETLILNVYTKF